MLSLNEKKKQNQNFVEKRRVNLARQDLDRQLERKQSQLRREVEMITDQFLDQRAFPGTSFYPPSTMTTTRSRKKPTTEMDSSTYEDSSAALFKPTQSSGEPSVHFNNDNAEPPYPKLDIYGKFVVQKRKYYPTYLRRPAKLNKSLNGLEGML